MEIVERKGPLRGDQDTMPNLIELIGRCRFHVFAISGIISLDRRIFMCNADGMVSTTYGVLCNHTHFMILQRCSLYEVHFY
jgi:hypothetical protein